ncbi:MAG: tetratricopeptide repeat protein [Candidatus Hydrogenedentes bacterium]|nr:tetratricopeptide repeat protein [Candidatus Hydrogenedentota bacterium]
MADDSGHSYGDRVGGQSNPVPEPLISQDELDAALAAELAARKERMRKVETGSAPPPSPRVPFQPPPPVSLPPDLGLIGQGELDDVVMAFATNGQKTPGTVAPADLEDGGAVDQDEIDRLLRSVQDAASTPSATPVQAHDSATARVDDTAPEEVGGAIDQDEIDRLLQVSLAVEPSRREEPTHDTGTATQDEIDQLLRREADRVAKAASEPAAPEHNEKPAQAVGSGATLGQSDIDLLLQSIAGASTSMAQLRAQDAASAPSDGGSIPADIPPQADSAETESTQLSQGDLDALLASIASEDVLDNRDLDTPLTPVETSMGSDMDEAFTPPAASASGPPAPAVMTGQTQAQPGSETDPVQRAKRVASESQVGSENIAAAVPQVDELLDAVIASAAKEVTGEAPAESIEIPSIRELSEEIGENLAAASPARDDMAVRLSDTEIAEIDLLQRPVPDSTGESVASTLASRESLGSRVLGVLTGLAGGGTLKTWTSLAAAVACTVGTFAILQSVREREPGGQVARAPIGEDISALVRSASALVDMRQFSEAKKLLAPVIGEQPASDIDPELLYLHIAASYGELPEKVKDTDTERLHQEINQYLAVAGNQMKSANVLRWKADLYERAGADIAALDTYRNLLITLVDVSGTDETLIRAARVTDRLGRLDEQQQFAQRLLDQHSDSAYVPEARLLLAKAYAKEGHTQDAENIFRQVALAGGDSPVGAQAVAHLGEMALARGDHAAAIRDLENRLETATTIEGNDVIYLLLAKAYRVSGAPGKAEEILRELISFFPESERTPDAFVELSRTLDELGNRREALKVAMLASQRFRDRADVLANEGELLQLSGRDAEAAESFLAAAQAGGDDPRTLLAAGKAFERVNELRKAREAYEHLLMVSPQSAEAFEGNLHLASVLLKQGQAESALDRLSNLAIATTGKAQHIQVLESLGGLYADLGFAKHAAETYAAAAGLTNDPEVLAQTTLALLRVGDAGTALATARRVDPQTLSPATAYAFLCGHGKALLRMDAALALEKMEQAYNKYPDLRTEEGDNDLLNALLVTGQMARARALVMDLKTRVGSHPDEAPRLQRTAVRWADVLFEHGDYTAAAEAYALAAEAAPEGGDSAWAKFQEANSRLKLNEFAEGVGLLDEVAASDAPFAEDARLKAEYARLEMRLRSGGTATSTAPMGG